ncbi:MAG: hypothetical protein ACFC1C_04365 [Candidatus Malihini olakiniferum]
MRDHHACMMILILASTLIIGLLFSTFFIIHRNNQLQDQPAKPVLKPVLLHFSPPFRLTQ